MTRAGLVGVTILAVCWPHAGHGQSRENAGVPATSAPVVVASKPFGESYILAEMFSQLLESRGIAVERRAGLGATEIAFGALRVNAIDVYPEYTGTGLLAILQDTLDVAMRTDARATFAYVARVFEERYGVRWLAPLGFENGYAIAVRRETATRYQLRTLTDLARVGGELTAGFTSDFIGRPDGLDGLSREYGLRLEAVRPLAPAVKYAAIAERAVDVIDGYSTDGLLARYDLVTLDDDRNFFPPYQAAAVLSPRLSAERSDAISVLSLLSGRLDEGRMRTYNRRVEVDGEDIRAVAADALGELGLVPQEERNGESEAGSGPDPVSNDSPARVGIVPFLWSRRLETGVLALRHPRTGPCGAVCSSDCCCPAGPGTRARAQECRMGHRGARRASNHTEHRASRVHDPLLGVGTKPALVALWLYALYPIARNTYTGVRDADIEAVDACEAMGATAIQRLLWVRLPLAAPIILAGVRTAAVITVGAATLAAFIGAGGLGEPIVTGLALADSRLVLAGAIPAALLALLVDSVLALVERAVSPAHLRAGNPEPADLKRLYAS